MLKSVARATARPVLVSVFLSLSPGVALMASANGADTASRPVSIPSYVAMAVADSGRPPSDTPHDASRKPAEIVAFSGIKPGMHIAEFSPGDGYYTRILSKIAGPKGRVFTVVPFASSIDARALREANKDKVLPIDQALALSDIKTYENITVLWENVGQMGGQFPLPEQVDAVFAYGNYHDLHTRALEYTDMNTKATGNPNVTGTDRAILQTMKVGGTFTVIDHVAAKDAGWSAAETLHRSDADKLKAEILTAGFVLDGESNILSNISDDHSKSADDASLRDKTDQIVLRFKKPAGALADARPKDDPVKNYYENTYVYNTGPAERHHFYHANGTYEEFGKDDMQQGWWFWDAAGHWCMVHQTPVPQRQYDFCAPDIANHQVGEKWTVYRTWRGTTEQTLLKGHVYF